MLKVPRRLQYSISFYDIKWLNCQIFVDWIISIFPIKMYTHKYLIMIFFEYYCLPSSIATNNYKPSNIWFYSFFIYLYKWIFRQSYKILIKSASWRFSAVWLFWCTSKQKKKKTVVSFIANLLSLVVKMMMMCCVVVFPKVFKSISRFENVKVIFNSTEATTKKMTDGNWTDICFEVKIKWKFSRQINLLNRHSFFFESV